MRETVTINRIICCNLLNKEVAQQISAYSKEDAQGKNTSEMITKYCSGEQWCHSQDCQFTNGLSGKNYTKPLDAIYRIFED
ncbi:MAG: hypothetical protein LLG02_15045 [Pelosinus sp.]|nr:hypothetical protein [Pelosinus sp.]